LLAITLAAYAARLYEFLSERRFRRLEFREPKVSREKFFIALALEFVLEQLFKILGLDSVLLDIVAADLGFELDASPLLEVVISLLLLGIELFLNLLE
jgi:hypothetical protein